MTKRRRTAAPQAPTLADLCTHRRFEPKGVASFQTMADGRHFTRLEDERRVGLYRFSTGTRVRTLFNVRCLKARGIDRIHDYVVSEGGDRMLVATNRRALYRHSFFADYYVVDPRTREVTPLSERAPQRLATFSPDGKQVAFVHHNDLYVKDLARNRERRITRDGREGHVINGAPDWVYEEEFGLAGAFAWSPDGRHLAYLRFDETRVREHELVMYEGADYPRLVRYKYPRAGEVNAIVEAFVADTRTGRSVRVDTGRRRDQYLPRIGWGAGSGPCCVVRMNRGQDRVDVLRVDPCTGGTEAILSERHERYVELHGGPVLLEDHRGLLWYSERSGFRHLYLYGYDGACHGAVTEGPFETTFLAFHAGDDRVFYNSTEVSSLERHLYSSRLDGTDRKKLTRRSGWHGARFGPDCTYAIRTFSSASRAPRITLHDRQGRQVRVLEDNARVTRQVRRFGHARPEFFTFTNRVGIQLNGWLVKPLSFSARKRYPLVMTVYGGPGSQTVTDQWRYGWEQVLAAQGFLVASVDGRGTGARGNAFRTCTHLQLGRYETEDQVSAARYLGRLPFVDRKRIGIFGWSYGGFMAANCTLRAPETFAAGIAVAPVTHWRYYDSIYTERYMRRPKDNPEGYEANGPLAAADQLQRPLLLIHGIADDNVHVQNTEELVNALVKAGKQFEVHTVPNRDHGIRGDGAGEHVFTRMTAFFQRHLQGVDR